MKNEKGLTIGAIGKWVLGTITSAGIIIGIIWVGLQHGYKQHDLGYAQGHGDTQVLRQLIEHKDSQIAALNTQLKLIQEALDSSSIVNMELKTLLMSNVVVSDTIIYEQDAISLFGGHVTIQCNVADTIGIPRFGNIFGTIFEGGTPRDFGLNGRIGDQSTFEFGGDKYLVVVLGCKKYDKGPGVKIAV